MAQVISGPIIDQQLWKTFAVNPSWPGALSGSINKILSLISSSIGITVNNLLVPSVMKAIIKFSYEKSLLLGFWQKINLEVSHNCFSYPLVSFYPLPMFILDLVDLKSSSFVFQNIVKIGRVSVTLN